MANSFVAWRTQLVFALCLPLAVLLGYMLADPNDQTSVLVITLVIGLLSVPVLMYSYHPLLIIAWNAAITPFFLPGQPLVWSIFAFVGFGFAVLNRFTSAEARFADVPSLAKPLLAVVAITVLTGFARGGFAVRAFGAGQFGGKSYFYIVAAVLGFFALVSQRIPKHRAGLFVSLFFLSGMTTLVPNLAYMAGRQLEFLYFIFQAGYALEQAMGEYNPMGRIVRVAGLTGASMALYCWVLARYGLKGVLDINKPLRLLLLVLAILGCLYSGYRGYMLLFILTLAIQFCAERLYQARTLLVMFFCGLLVSLVTLPNLDKLPLAVQRSLSFLPLKNFDASVKISAEGSSEWRINMWRDVLVDLQAHKYEYLYLGKGYKLDPKELDTPAPSGYGYNWAIVSSNYHNGPLTVLIPLGIWGFAAFLWFVIASMKYLYRNYRYGDSDLRTINTFLLAFFIARFIYYMLIFGNFFSELFYFTGIVGLSVSLNGAQLPVVATAEESSVRGSEADSLAPAPAQ